MISNNEMEEVVISSDSDSETDPDKPLILLFKRLIESENKQQTILKNSHIHEILGKEFNIDTKGLHILEVDIYLTVVKKFLKQWPEWDAFDKIVSEARKKGSVTIPGAVLKEKYASVKSFLQNVLDMARPLAKEAVRGMKEKETDGPVLDVSATKTQLKNLFFRYPNPKCSMGIFNTNTDMPCQIRVRDYPLRSILNMWGVTVTINSPAGALLYKHETNHEFKYVLVNKKLINEPKKYELNQEIEYNGSTDNVIDIENIISYFKYVYGLCAMDEFMEIVDFIIISLRLLPQEVFQECTYKQHTNKYPYIRYFFEDVSNASNEDMKKYDLQLQETITPLHEIYLGSFINVIDNGTYLSQSSITATCTACSVTFQGNDIINSIKMHFNVQHQSENDIQCSNCEEIFSVENIAKNWWCHKCKQS